MGRRPKQFSTAASTVFEANPAEKARIITKMKDLVERMKDCPESFHAYSQDYSAKDWFELYHYKEFIKTTDSFRIRLPEGAQAIFFENKEDMRKVVEYLHTNRKGISEYYNDTILKPTQRSWKDMSPPGGWVSGESIIEASNLLFELPNLGQCTSENHAPTTLYFPKFNKSISNEMFPSYTLHLGPRDKLRYSGELSGEIRLYLKSDDLSILTLHVAFERGCDVYEFRKHSEGPSGVNSVKREQFILIPINDDLIGIFNSLVTAHQKEKAHKLKEEIIGISKHVNDISNHIKNISGKLDAAGLGLGPLLQGGYSTNSISEQLREIKLMIGLLSADANSK